MEIRDLFDATPCGILEFDHGGKITATNAQLQRLLGYSADELQSLRFDDLLTVSARIFYQTHFFPLLKLHGHAEEIFLTLRDKQDRQVPMLTNATRREGAVGARTVCALMPVHQRMQYEEEILLARRKAEEALNSNEELKRSRAELEIRLRQLDQNLTTIERRSEELVRLNQIMSHDLREPVRKIEVFLGLLLDENQDAVTNAGKLAIQRIKASCLRMNYLLETLQEFLLIDTTREPLVTVNLSEVLAAAARSADLANINAVILPTIQGYRGQLEVLFERLLRSASLRAGDGAPAVNVDCTIIQHNTFQKLSEKYEYADFAQIIMRDNGRPFNCVDCHSLFQLLRKSNEADSHPDLAVCQRIIDNHHGLISLESPAGQGAIFKILLPTSASEPSA